MCKHVETMIIQRLCEFKLEKKHIIGFRSPCGVIGHLHTFIAEFSQVDRDMSQMVLEYD